MAHNLMQNKDGSYAFVEYTADGKPDAWHRLGTTVSTPMSAMDMWREVLHEPYNVLKMPLMWPGGNFSGQFGIAKITDVGAIDKCFGVVSEKYNLLTPEDFCFAWDSAGEFWGKKNPWKVETMGALGDGETFWCLSAMPNCDIAGEEYRRYVIGVNSMDGKSSNLLKITAVRVVCANTMAMALNEKGKETTSIFKVDHDTEIVQNTIQWLIDVLKTAEDKANAVKEAMELFATKKLAEESFDKMLKVAMPVPAKPKQTGSPLYDAKLEEQWEQRNSVQIAKQGVVRGLYDGAMTGFDSIVKLGYDRTCYAAACAISEATDHVITGRGDMNSSYITGWRSDAKDKAFNFLLEQCRN